MPQVLGKEVGPIGFGLMGFTWRAEPQALEKTLDTMKAALENGLTVWNGAEFYGTPEYNSMTILKAYFTKYPEDADKVTIVMKGGVNPAKGPDGSAEFTRKSIENVINQLGGTKKLDIWGPGRRDQNTPLEETLRAAQEYIDAGKLGGVHLSECRAETIHEAAKYAKIAACEVELSMFTPDILKNGVAAACAQYDIPIVAYSPIGRGMLTGTFSAPADFKGRGFAEHFPRFQGEAFEQNIKLVRQVEELAKKKGCTAAQLAINWDRSLSQRQGLPTIIPIPGATTVPRVQENSKVIELSEEEIKAISDIVDSFETTGSRYPDGAPTNT